MRPTPAAFAASIAATLVRDLAGDVAAGQEEPVGAAQGPLERVAVGEVADGELDVSPSTSAARSGSRTNARGGHAALAQRADDCAPTLPVAPVTSTFIGLPPLLGGMLALSRKTLVGS